jgi:hypothetical protein
LQEKHRSRLSEALTALGFNLQIWEQELFDADGVLKKPMASVWLRFMKTYYFEEAYDIRRKTVVTNGRNFPLMILSTVQAILDDGLLANDEALYYFAVTPAHPKDMYNWPHGYIKPRAYFEEEFMGSFHRLLREIVHSDAYKARLVHGRFVLTCAESVEEKNQP